MDTDIKSHNELCIEAKSRAEGNSMHSQFSILAYTILPYAAALESWQTPNLYLTNSTRSNKTGTTLWTHWWFTRMDSEEILIEFNLNFYVDTLVALAPALDSLEPPNLVNGISLTPRKPTGKPGGSQSRGMQPSRKRLEIQNADLASTVAPLAPAPDC